MSIEKNVQSTLGALVSGRCYPLVSPEKPVTPYLIYQNVANTPEVTLSDGIPISNTRMQIDCYAKTYGEVKSLSDAVQNAMANASYTNVPLMQQDLYESDVKLYRVQMDYSLWY